MPMWVNRLKFIFQIMPMWKIIAIFMPMWVSFPQNKNKIMPMWVENMPMWVGKYAHVGVYKSRGAPGSEILLLSRTQCARWE